MSKNENLNETITEQEETPNEIDRDELVEVVDEPVVPAEEPRPICTLYFETVLKSYVSTTDIAVAAMLVFGKNIDTANAEQIRSIAGLFGGIIGEVSRPSIGYLLNSGYVEDAINLYATLYKTSINEAKTMVFDMINNHSTRIDFIKRAVHHINIGEEVILTSENTIIFRNGLIALIEKKANVTKVVNKETDELDEITTHFEIQIRDWNMQAPEFIDKTDFSVKDENEVCELLTQIEAC